jgi:hypothetical protein
MMTLLPKSEWSHNYNQQILTLWLDIPSLDKLDAVVPLGRNFQTKTRSWAI